MLIYLVEDDSNIAAILRTYLEKEGYVVVHFPSEKDAMKNITPAPQLWLLDVMLENPLSGFRIYDAIKQQAPAPTIFLSARDQEYDRLMGLEQGADDYITKPFSPREVVLKVRKLLNRVYPSTQGVITYGIYTIDSRSRNVLSNDKNIPLSTKEYDLLLYLLMRRHSALSRDDILDAVWGKNYYGSDRVVDDLMRRLRAHLPELDIVTVYGYGYRLQ